MVQPKSKAVFYFTVFVLPCLILYTVFFIYPFFHGFYISLTNWDGLTPKAPIIFEQGEFENQILNKVKNENDKTFLLSIYEFNRIDKSYSRVSISAFERNKLERILSSVGYAPANNRFVGFENYAKILTGQVNESFYPHIYTQINYNSTSSLPSFISANEFKNDILKQASLEDRALFLEHYELGVFNGEERYILKPQYVEFSIEDRIWFLPEIDSGKTVPEQSVDTLINAVKRAGLVENEAIATQAVTDFLREYQFSEKSTLILTQAVNDLYSVGNFKVLLSKTWVSEKLNLGVIGFTLFFAVFSVIGINILAFLLALVLDTKIKGRAILRSIFFLPNVLSMIIVALIWSMLFYQLLPALTGIDRWISDPAKTPWLLVLVAVWQGAGYYMIVYLAGLQNISPDVIEASTIDGAGPFQRFRFITLPLLLPAITISLFLTIANALKSFDLVYAMIGTTGYATGTVPFVMDIYFDAFAQKQAGMATAKAMLLFIAIFIVTGTQLFIMKRKEIEQ